MNIALPWEDRECAACGHIGPGRYQLLFVLALLLNCVFFGLTVWFHARGYFKGSGWGRTRTAYAPVVSEFGSLLFFRYLLFSPSAVRCPKCGGIYN